MITIAITGAAGRMGCRLVALAKQDESFQIVGAIERRDAAAAEAAMREHLQHARRFVEEQIAAETLPS